MSETKVLKNTELALVPHHYIMHTMGHGTTPAYMLPGLLSASSPLGVDDAVFLAAPQQMVPLEASTPHTQHHHRCRHAVCRILWVQGQGRAKLGGTLATASM
jgi:hypothetical protein